PEHPFWVHGSGWTGARSLAAGDRIVAADDHVFFPVALGWSAATDVYNLEVLDDHSYFVGRSRAWVHNTSRLTPHEGPTGTRSVDPHGEPFVDPAPPKYDYPSRPVEDHIQNRARGGHPTDPANIDLKTWEANSRKAGFEGNYTRDLKDYMSKGLTREEAEY